MGWVARERRHTMTAMVTMGKLTPRSRPARRMPSALHPWWCTQGCQRRPVADAEDERRVPRQRWKRAHLEARSLFDDSLLRSRRHAVLVDRGGGGVRHGGNELVGFGVG